MEKVLWILVVCAASAVFFWFLGGLLSALSAEGEPLKEIVFKKGSRPLARFFGLFGPNGKKFCYRTTVRFGHTCLYPAETYNELFTLKSFLRERSIGVTWMPVGDKNKVRLFLSQQNGDYYFASSIGDARVGNEYGITLSRDGDNWVCTVTLDGDMEYCSTSTIKIGMKWGYITGDKVRISENMPEEIKYWRN